MAISDELTRIQTAKADIKASIEAKGVTVPSSALIDQYADYVDEISGGGGGQAEEDLKNLIERDITSITIPSGTTKIGDSAFRFCSSLTTVTIPSSVTSIGSYAFQGCTNIGTTENYVKYIDGWAVELTATNMSSYTIKEGTKGIIKGLFYSNSSVSTISLPNTIMSIPDFFVAQCNGLSTTNIPNSVTSIGDNAFQNSGLTSVIIPSSVTSIGDNAFNSCRSLTSVTVEATTPPTLGSSVFNRTNNCPIYVPAESVAAYQAANRWSTYDSRIQAIPTT